MSMGPSSADSAWFLAQNSGFWGHDDDDGRTDETGLPPLKPPWFFEQETATELGFRFPFICGFKQAGQVWVNGARHAEHGDSLAERSPPEGQRKKKISGAVVTAPHQRAHQVSRPRQARPAHNFGCFEDRKLDPGNQCSVEEGPFSKRAPDRAALKDRHASSARTVRTGVPPLRVETAPP